MHTRPITTPAMATANISPHETSPAPSIQMPGMVNASPPATMAPADMMVCVTFASLRVAVPRLRSIALRKKREMMAAKIIGQGRAPIFSAV